MAHLIERELRLTFDRESPAEPSDIFFTDRVKEVQVRRGSRNNYARMAASGGFQTLVTSELAQWLAERDSFYMATANAQGQPYIQHRGGPPGFLRVLSPTQLAFADYRGNRQYISTGNLAENDQAMLFLMDYETRTRIKIWGRARIVEDDPALVATLMPEGYRAVPEQAVLFDVTVWDANCPQHIPAKVAVADVAPIITKLKARIAELEAVITAQGADTADR